MLFCILPISLVPFRLSDYAILRVVTDSVEKFSVRRLKSDKDVITDISNFSNKSIPKHIERDEANSAFSLFALFFIGKFQMFV